MSDHTSGRQWKRRAFLASTVSVAAGIAGCTGRSGTAPTDQGIDIDNGSSASSARQGEPVRMDSLPTLQGNLTVYLGRGEGGLYAKIVDFLENRRYDDFDVTLKRGPSASLANTIVTEERNDTSPADVFWSIDAASLGLVAQSSLAHPVPKSVASNVPAQFRDGDRRWIGVSGRARAIPYNPTEVSADQVPESVFELPESDAFDDLGWAPTYGSFQAFVTAMRLQHGNERTREWLTAMQDAGVTSYPGEFGVTHDVSQGTIAGGVANHYYALRLKEAKPEAPIDLGFTSGGPGSLINVGGALVVRSSEKRELATNFIHHLLAQELQEFLVRKAFEYPLAPGVETPSGDGIDLPPIEALDPPDIDLTKLANLQPTLDLLRETGAL